MNFENEIKQLHKSSQILIDQNLVLAERLSVLAEELENVKRLVDKLMNSIYDIPY